MPDNPLLGPTGQPIKPNPFTQTSGVSGSMSINTSQAQKAMEDFQRTLENIMKGFGGTWEKVTGNRLAAEERFYRAIGDKETARKKEFERYSNDAISSIKEETRAKIDSLNEQFRAGTTTQEQLEKQKTEITEKAERDREKITKEVQKKLASERGLGGFIRDKASSLGERIGGPIGGLVSGAGQFFTNPWSLIGTAIFETLVANARSARVGSELAGAGFRLGAGAGVGSTFTSGLFGGPVSRLGLALGAEQQARLIGTMTGSRTMIDQARVFGGTESITNNLGLFANILPDASKEMELFTDATKSLGMTQGDITKTFVSSRVNADRLKITQIDAIETQLAMQKALRNITNDGAVASNVLNNISDYLTHIGASEVEKQRIGLSVAQAGSNLTLPQIVGMFGFTHGGKLPTPQDLFGETGKGGLVGTGGVFGLMGSFLQKVGRQTPENSLQRLLVENQLQQQFLPGLRLQDLPQFNRLVQNMMGPGANVTQFQKEFEKLEGKTPQVAAAEGINKLVEIVGPIQLVENFVTNFWRDLDRFVIRFVDPKHNKQPIPGDPNYVNPWKPTQRSIKKNERHEIFSNEF